MMKINICGRPTKVDAARMVLILTAAWRVEVLREMKRLAKRRAAGVDADALRAELEAELQAMDELAHDAQEVTL